MNGATGSGAQDGSARQSAIDRAEHAGNLVRFRSGVALGAVAWSAWAFVDGFFAHGDTRVHMHLLGLRVLGLCAGLAVLLWLRFKREVTPAQLLVADVGLFSLCSAIFGAMSVETVDIGSVNACGVMMILVAHHVILPSAWPRGLIPLLVPGLSYPLVLLVAGLYSPTIRAQLHEPEHLDRFLLLMGNLATLVFILLVGDQVTWTLRRQVYSSRAIGKYRLLRKLGAGGMGEVWAAHHAGLRREVALKILKAGVGDAVALGRFEREVHAMSELSHPNTVRVFDYGTTDDGLRYYAMELLEGQDLGKVISQSGPLSAARAVRLVSQAARALAEAHARGIVHRDVKPENIFVATLGGEADVVKVLDFGIARSTAPDEVALTSTGFVAGTPRYMAPEAFTASGPPAPTSDVYALGLVLYAALAGRPPFELGDTAALARAHISEAPLAPSRKRGEKLPEPLDALVLRCLEKDPARRFAHAGALAAALDEVAPGLPDLPIGAGVPLEPEVLSATVPSVPRRG